MLCELAIENLALFEGATLTFGAGLNAITGETGAGKSLLIDALELLLGERPRASLVRKGAKEARVEGRFVLAAESTRARELATWFEANLPAALEEWSALALGDERELILSRTLSAEGRSRAWINHRPVTQRVLRELAALLVEIHGQNEHQRVLEPQEQLRLLDAFGELDLRLATYRAARASWIEASRALAEFELRARERRDRLDLLRFQARELGDAKLSIDEHAGLIAEREVQRNASALGGELGGVVDELVEGDAAALGAVRKAVRALERWEHKITTLAPPAEELRQALAHLEEACGDLARFRDGLEYSPERLEAIEQRLFVIERLATKYHLDVAGLVARRGELERELAAMEGEAVDQGALVEGAAKALAELETRAAALTQARRALRARLKKEVERRLAELGLEKARFDVKVEPRVLPEIASPNVDARRTKALAEERRFGMDGADVVEFQLAANPGEDAQALRLVASGGEAARILLALRTALALRQSVPTLVFDEIDSGVGGRLGPKVGEHLKELAGTQHQVLCVTHLPAIAAVADHHFQVKKSVAGGRTKTSGVELDGEERVAEIADMIAGGGGQATARAEAKRLLGG
ncbi:MAG: DNA repair protein RecN [Planctomycetes bacterium]|nr:DNA repair protein RecN [Planctomycetota bacterium]